ncbi:MAG: ATP-dependent DNA helicase RecG [Dehalococcoidia bacterium]
MTGTDSLRNVLELECQKGYTDKAVIGGLDRYLHRQAKEIRQGLLPSLNEVKTKERIPQLLSSFDELNLANSDYGSCDVAERKRWIMNVLDWLDELERAKNTAGDSQPSATRRADSFAAAPRPDASTSAGAEPSATAHSERPEEPNPARSRVRREPGASSRRVTTAVAEPGRKVTESLDSPITVIKGITPNIAKKFARLNVREVRDLLYFFPRRYVDYSQTKPISELVEGEEQTIVGTIWQARIASLGVRRGTEAIVGDETGNIRVVWFNQPYLAKSFRTNARVVISGTVSEFKGRKVFESPEWELLKDKELIHTGRLVPVYPLTQGLYPRQVRKWTKEIVDGYAWQLDDFLPEEIRRRCQMLDLPTAIAQVHFPDDRTMAESARRRLAFDELLLLQLGVLARKRDWQEGQPGNALHIAPELIDRFLGCLPFSLTRAQERVWQEISGDLRQPKAMSRLLQGEVGSGKTVIATLALLVAAANDYQGALMAPTEVLAEQHYSGICSYLAQVSTQEYGGETGEGTIRRYTGFASKPLTIALLIGSLSGPEKAKLRDRIGQGEVDIVVGTHALIQKEVEFTKLGLVVIDEQHRFGVVQRSALRQKGFNPHVLVMTATPIPRTMALTLYGDLDLSVIDELPPGRQVVKTRCVEPKDREKAYTFLYRQVSNGRQAFIICPLIEESEILEAKAAKTEHERLSREVFPDLKLGLLHGQMHGSEKEEVMRRFRGGEFDVLVSTSVVEVGIDVPRASVMLVEGAERFGLSQLHQFRGRVGRDKEQGYCMLIPEKLSPEARWRLGLMEKVHDGFALAEKDLEMRGPGEFFGTHQSGLPDLRLAKLTDLRSMELARQEAITLFQRDPGLKKEEHQLLRKHLNVAWSRGAEWS